MDTLTVVITLIGALFVVSLSQILEVVAHRLESQKTFIYFIQYILTVISFVLVWFAAKIPL